MKSGHSESSYQDLVEKKLQGGDRKAAMEASIGGNFSHFGQFQRALLFNYGLSEDSTLLDIGCGSGRLAVQLSEFKQLRYTGVDVVPDLLEYAEAACAREDWRFLKISDFKIPLADACVDMVCAFSVFTHLLHEESFAYLAEARRVLKPNGKIVFTFLDFTVPEHLAVFYSNLALLDNRVHLNQFVHHESLRVWADLLRLDVVAIKPGNENYIQLSKPVIADDGREFNGDVTLGQSLCVLQKRQEVDRVVLARLPEDFDAEAYLAANPDVAAAGVEAGTHFLWYGQYENRKLRP